MTPTQTFLTLLSCVLIQVQKYFFKPENPTCPTLFPATRHAVRRAFSRATWRESEAITLAINVSPAPIVSTIFPLSGEMAEHS